MLFSCISLFFSCISKARKAVKRTSAREFSYTELTLIRSRILPTNILLSPSQGERGGGLYD